MYYRTACDFEYWGEDTCGWVYEDSWTYEEYFVTCDDFSSWWWC